MPRFRVRTLMVVVALIALMMASVGPTLRWRKRWIYHRRWAASYARMEQKARTLGEKELRHSNERGEIRQWLVKTQGLAGKSERELERAVDQTVSYYQEASSQAFRASADWREKRQLSETAAWWCWDPFAPDVP